ncbi:hypothetical protein AB0C29_42250, partial [Actinoplanes sp. NPDC048791]
GWGTSAGEFSNAIAGPDVYITSAPGITSAADLDDVLAPGRRIGGSRSVSGGAAPMGGRSMGSRDVRGDGIIHEEERGGDHDW